MEVDQRCRLVGWPTQASPWSTRSGSRAIWVLNGPIGSEALAITLEEDGNTLLTGPIADQAALYGLLRKVRDLGMPLISFHRVEPGPTDTSGGSK